MTSRNKIYFASDFHLGIPDKEKSLKREKDIVRWLDSIKEDARELYLVGDIFDFWFEYKHVVPKGYVRLLGKLLELKDSGVEIHYFTGNHDLWMFGYLEEELGIPVYHKPITKTIGDKKFFIGHGDGLGPEDKGYKMLKRVFRNPLCQKLFSWLHPDIGIFIANKWSRYSRYTEDQQPEEFLGEDEEWLIQYCRRKLKEADYDYFIFGHRHLPIDYKLNENSRYINLGDWLYFYTYAVFDGGNLELTSFKNDKQLSRPVAVNLV